MLFLFPSFLEGEHMLERDYQAKLIRNIKRAVPGCIVWKNDTSYMQGIPDLLVLYQDRWAVLEVKSSEDSPDQPNQDWWIHELDEMSFGAFIYPENEREVLDALRKAFGTNRSSRLSRTKRT
jgi:hypothetical protein